MSVRKGNIVIANGVLFDPEPVENSTNAVYSGGLYNVLNSIINSKQDKLSGIGAYVTEKYRSSDGKTWYRKWSDGFQECGMEIKPNGSNETIAIPSLTFTTTTYYINGISLESNTSMTTTLKIHSRSSTSFVCHGEWQTGNGQGATSGDVTFLVYICGY